MGCYNDSYLFIVLIFCGGCSCNRADVTRILLSILTVVTDLVFSDLSRFKWVQQLQNFSQFRLTREVYVVYGEMCHVHFCNNHCYFYLWYVTVLAGTAWKWQG